MEEQEGVWILLQPKRSVPNSLPASTQSFDQSMWEALKPQFMKLANNTRKRGGDIKVLVKRRGEFRGVTWKNTPGLLRRMAH